jgi:hypothetical protein
VGSVLHGWEVGDGSVRCGGARREVAALDRRVEGERRHPGGWAT